MSSIGRRLAWLAAVLGGIAALNLIWLATSSMRIENASDRPLDAIAFSACETVHTVGTLAPGESVFRFLEACGDDTLEIRLGGNRFCQTYVEGELYHVVVELRSTTDVRCRYEDAFSTLLVREALL